MLSTGVSQHVLLPAGWRSQTDTAVVCSNATENTVHSHWLTVVAASLLRYTRNNVVAQVLTEKKADAQHSEEKQARYAGEETLARDK